MGGARRHAGGAGRTGLHEAGHALAALALRQPGVHLTIGGGRATLMEARLRTVRLRIANPSLLRGAGGQVQWDADRTTLRGMLVIALAGPAATTQTDGGIVLDLLRVLHSLR